MHAISGGASRSAATGGLSAPASRPTACWEGPRDAIAFDPAGIAIALGALDRPCYVVRAGNRIGATSAGTLVPFGHSQVPVLAFTGAMAPENLGDAGFRQSHGVKWSYMAGAMANGIASADLVISLGKEKILGSFGAAGLEPDRLEANIHLVQHALPAGPYAFNLIHSPSEEAIERRTVELYLKYGVATVEASAFLDLTPHVVYYRVAGLHLDASNEIHIGNRLIAKVSRREVAEKFLSPPPERLLTPLLQAGLISQTQARLAASVPMCDEMTVEADSAGHTDNRPLVCLLPSILSLRDEMQDRHGYAEPIRVGAAGGIGTPEAAVAAFAMGASYVVTGSVNQACVEAGTSERTRLMLAGAGMADVAMAPAADMFEMGVRLQLLKRGTLFPMRAQSLYELYRAYESLDEIPTADRVKLERQIFRQSLDRVWEQTAAYFATRDPEQLARAERHPKRKMALAFRWYLGLASRWAISGETGRDVDYQIWCGPAMGAFNDWVRGSYLESPDQRRVGDVARHIMSGAAYLSRLHTLQIQGIRLASAFRHYRPERISPSM